MWKTLKTFPYITLTVEKDIKKIQSVPLDLLDLEYLGYKILKFVTTGEVKSDCEIGLQKQIKCPALGRSRCPLLIYICSLVL